MKEMIEKWMPKIENLFNNYVHKIIFIVFLIILIQLIFYDLFNSNDEYIKHTIYYIIFVWISLQNNALEIANTPFASLTISNIILFVEIVIFNVVCIFAILFLIKRFLISYNEENYY